MRYLVILFVLLLWAAETGATEYIIIPYGDYTSWCTAYGTCRERLDRKDAERAIADYFTMRSLQAARILHRGRFIEAEIYRDGRLVDKILFDRKTGRIRSIY